MSLVPSLPVLALASLLTTPEEGRRNHPLLAINHLAGIAKPKLSRERIFPRPRFPDQHFCRATNVMPEKSVRKLLQEIGMTQMPGKFGKPRPQTSMRSGKFKVFFW